MKKSTLIIYISIFFLVCTIPSLLTLLGYESKNYEKRALAEKPSIMEDKTDFTKNFDDYFSENFALRPQFITAYAKLNSFLFKTSSSDKVIIGKDGYLFFRDTLDDYTGKNILSGEELEYLSIALKQKQDMLEAQGIEFLFVVAPNKNTIYPDMMPSRFTQSDVQNNTYRLYAHLNKYGVNYVDVTQSLLGQRNLGFDVYHKTDSHWNNFGAAVAYEDVMYAAKLLLPEKNFDIYSNTEYTESLSHHGDLQKMIYPASDKKEEQQDFRFEKTFKSEKPLVNLQAIEIVTENESSDHSALIFRDSFFIAQIPYFSQNFENVEYLRTVPYPFEKAADMNADIVILEIAQRNIPELLKNLY